MGKELLINLENNVEKNINKNEYSKAILGSIRDTFDDIIKYSKDKDKEKFTLYELDRVANRTENLLSLLNDFLLDSTELNYEIINQVSELKREEM